MRSVHALLLSLAASLAVVNAERGMRYSPDVPYSDTSMRHAKETETATDLIAALTEHFQRSSAMLQHFLGFNSGTEVVRIVVREQAEENPAVERKTACVKAMEIMHDQKELEHETETLMQYIRSAFDLVSIQVWGGPSCTDLGRPELVDQVQDLVLDCHLLLLIT